MTALLLAAFPTALYAMLLWRLDRYEKEPLSLLLAAFVWGALPALLIAGLVELGIESLSTDILGPDSQARVIAPLVEEPLKAVALIGLFRWARREFNGVVDGIIYGALVGFGFAMSENVLYYWSHSGQLLGLWFVRSIVFGFNHALFTSIVGIALGLVRLDRRRWVGYASLPLALTLAMLLHSLHNTLVTNGLIGLGLAWLSITSGVLVVCVIVVIGQRQERHWLQAQLPEECEDHILSKADLKRVLNPALRVRGEVRVLLRSGWPAYRHLRRFHHLLSELAFLKHQLAIGDRNCCSEDVTKLRALVVAQRAVVADWP